MKDFQSAKISRVGTATGFVGKPLTDLIGRPVVSVTEFGAVANGTTDCTTPILNAANYLLGLGGGTLYFPGVPSSIAVNYYKVTAALDFTSCSNAVGHRRLDIIGDNASETAGSWIMGSVNGNALIKQGSNNPQVIRSIRGIGVHNTASGGIGIEFNGAQAGEIRHCYVKASGVGILSNNEGGGLFICSCDIVGDAVTGIGVQMHQTAVEHCNVVGWDVAICMLNAGCKVAHNRIEQNRYGIKLGCGILGIGRATSSGTTAASGTTLTIAEFYLGTADRGVGSNLVVGRYSAPIAHNTLLTGGPGVGVYTTDQPTYFDNETVVILKMESIKAFEISSNTFERNDLAIDNILSDSGAYSGNILTGTVGSRRSVTGITWASTAGGTATVTTTGHKYAPGSSPRITIEADIGNNTNYCVNYVVAAVPNATQFTYPLTPDPGAYTAPGNHMLYSTDIPYAMRMRGAVAVAVNGLSTSGRYGVAALDLTYDGNTTLGGVVFNGQSISNDAVYGTTVISPPTNQRARFNSGTLQFNLLFNQLPGEVDGPSGMTPEVGMEYTVTNARDAGGAVPDFGERATLGGGTTAIKLFCQSVSGGVGFWVRSA